jgi:hypothetical protein
MLIDSLPSEKHSANAEMVRVGGKKRRRKQQGMEIKCSALAFTAHGLAVDLIYAASY